MPAPEPEPEPFDPSYDEVDGTPDERDRFVPPDPGPGPRMVLPRDLPWLGVLGVPVLLIASLLAGVHLPTWFGYLLVGAFVGSFVRLVLTMRRGGRDPWDDGARV